MGEGSGDGQGQRILVVGGGGREHALCWALARRGHRVTAAPGNPGVEEVAALAPVATDDLDGLVRLAAGFDLVVVGPEAPLVAGLADRVRAAGIPCLGPGRDGARLEGSKAWAKEFFARHAIPTAEFAVCATAAEVDAALARLGDEVVVKADGLAAGKGVVVCHDGREARAEALAMIEGGALGAAGRRVVLERRLAGREASVLALTDGARFVVLPPAEDHKAVLDGDRGPNTGGMGVVSPTPAVTPAVLARVRDEILAPTVRGLAAEGIPYRGVLYAGLMIDAGGRPRLLEYNCRLGDPEAEPLLARWDEDPAPWLLGAATGRLPARDELAITERAAVCVVLAAAGYPAAPRTGDPITGLPEARVLPDVHVFHAGTRRVGDLLVTAGGRVLAVVALGDDLAVARARAYAAADRIAFEGKHCRRDIGLRGERRS